jgi:hypothetical protein
MFTGNAFTGTTTVVTSLSHALLFGHDLASVICAASLSRLWWLLPSCPCLTLSWLGFLGLGFFLALLLPNLGLSVRLAWRVHFSLAQGLPWGFGDY